MVGGFVFVVFFRICCFRGKNLSNVFATFHLVLADRRATARTTTFVEPCSIQTKKSLGLVRFVFFLFLFFFVVVSLLDVRQLDLS